MITNKLKMPRELHEYGVDYLRGELSEKETYDWLRFTYKAYHFPTKRIFENFVWCHERLQKFFQQAGIEQRLWAESFAGYFTN
jgi:hypothetical protein